MVKGCENQTFLVSNLTRSRKKFGTFETIHPFSQSNQGKSNFEYGWVHGKPKKITFYDSTVTMQNRKKKKKRGEKNEKRNDRAHFTF